jgi:uncharacterized RDD family membrane protein YckC
MYSGAMKVTHLRWLFLSLLALMILLAMAFPGERRSLGISVESSDGDYHFAGGTDPAALGFAVLFIGGYVVLMNGTVSAECRPLAGVFRRFIAFWADLIIAMMTVAPILGIIPMFVEWRRTGEFHWTFERTTSATGDALQAALLVTATFAALLLYHAVALSRQRPSPGACIMGYRVVPDDGTTLTLKRSILRSLFGSIAVCVAYIAPFVARDRKRGKFWLDQVFSTHAVTLEG